MRLRERIKGWLQRAIGMPISWVTSWQHGRPAWTSWSIAKAITEGYRAHGVIYSCVRRLSDASASVPWVAKERTDDGEELVTEQPVNALMARPNPRWSWQDLMQVLCIDLNLGGNGYWLLLWEGDTHELWRLRPDWVTPILDEKLFVSGYQWTVGQKKVVLPARDEARGMAVIHFRFIDPGSDVLGLSPLQAVSRVVDTDNAAIDWNYAALQNQARPPGALSAPDTLDDAQYARLKEQIAEQMSGPKNARIPLLLEGGLEWQQHGFNPTEMDFLKGREVNAIEICEAFGVRPEWLGRIPGKFENVRQARRITWEDTIIPYLVDIKGTMNLQLAPILGENLLFDYDLSRTPAVLEARGELVKQAKVLWGMGVPFNQVNEQLGLGFEPVPGGDMGYLPAMLLPIEGTDGEESQQAVAALPAAKPRPALAAGTAPRAFPRPRVPAGSRVLNLDTEERKERYWRAFERQRLRWERGARLKIKERFAAELKVLLEQLEAGVHDLSMAIEDQLPAWDQLLSAVWQGVFEQFGAETAEALGMEVKRGAPPSSLRTVWDPWPEEAQNFVAQSVGEHITEISETTKLAVRKEIAEGLAALEDTPKIAKRLQGLYEGFGRNRSYVIARTEVGGAANYGTHQAAEQSGVVETHTWVSSRDDRVRDSHAAIDGETVPLKERYSNGLLFPSDPAGAAADVVNCRCVEVFGTGD